MKKGREERGTNEWVVVWVKKSIYEEILVYELTRYRLLCNILSSWQSSTEALIAATSYLDLFLRSITDANLMKVFLEFILVERSDGMPILDLLVSRIAHESQVNTIWNCKLYNYPRNKVTYLLTPELCGANYQCYCPSKLLLSL